MIERRVKKRVPTAYLLNEAWLHGYRFYVDERTIIPRSFIAELLKDGLEPWVPEPAAVRDVLDLCTGSGCLAIMAADVFPVARVDAVDLSDEALLVARRNVDDYQLQDRLTLRKSNLFEALPQEEVRPDHQQSALRHRCGDGGVAARVQLRAQARARRRAGRARHRRAHHARVARAPETQRHADRRDRRRARPRSKPASRRSRRRG